jgi:hypothetical protein
MQWLKSRRGNAGIQRRAEYASIIEKNRVYMGIGQYSRTGYAILTEQNRRF